MTRGKKVTESPKIHGAANGSFVREEYKEKWMYVRHTEDIRYKMFNIYIILVGGVLSFFVKDVVSLEQLFENKILFIPLFVLILYSIFMNLLLLLQKRNYKIYTDRLQDIERHYCNFVIERGATRIITVFRLYYSLLLIIGSGLSLLFVYVMSEHLVLALICAGGYFSVFMLISLLPPFKH